MTTRRVIVVGGGISGLAAAHELHQHGVEVMVLEATGRAGGKLAASTVGDIAVEEGADAFLARVPWAVELCEQLDLRDDLVSPAARSARIWSHGRMHRIPQPMVLGVPLEPHGLAASGLISVDGAARASADLDRDDDPLLHDAADESIGALIRRRLGDEVHERLVDPLLGGINAGDADHLSLAARAAQIDRAARSSASLIEGLRAQLPTSASTLPVFYSHRNGLSAIVAALVERLGASVRLATPVTAVEPVGGHWTVTTARSEVLEADAVLLACPAHVSAELLQPLDARAAELTGSIEFASVSLATFLVPKERFASALDASGFLVPKPEGFVMTATQFLSSKWEHLAHPTHETLRVSAGRDGDTRAFEMSDAEFVTQCAAELQIALDVEVDDLDARVTRWADAFPQYRPGHIDLIATIEEHIAQHPGLDLTGAAYGGLGIPDCIRQGVEAGRRLHSG